MARAHPSFKQQNVQWNKETFVLPEMQDLQEVFWLRPLTLMDRFMAIKSNRRHTVTDNMKSCLTIMFITYLSAAEKQKIVLPNQSKGILEEFKTSRQWYDIVGQHSKYDALPSRPPPLLARDTKDTYRPHHLSPPAGPPQAPKGPSSSRRQTEDTPHKSDGLDAPRRPLSSSAKHTTGPTERISTAPTKSEELWSSRLWKMPAAPVCTITEMTFDKFVEVFSQKNEIDPLKGLPWERVVSLFQEYVSMYWPHAQDGTAQQHIIDSLSRTKWKDRHSSAVVERQLRRLQMEVVGESKEREKIRTRLENARQQMLNNAESRMLESGNASDSGKATEEGRKRTRENSDGSPKSPPTKHIKLEQESPMFESSKQAGTNAFTASARQPIIPSEAEQRLGAFSPSLLPRNSALPTQMAGKGTDGINSGSHLHPLDARDASESIANFVGGESVPGSATVGSMLGDMPRAAAPSPAPSATAWLQANIPAFPPFQTESQPLSEIAAPVAALPPGVGEPARNPTESMSVFSGSAPGPAAMSARGLAAKSMVKLEIILNGGLGDLETLVAKAREPGTTEPLTSDQSHVLGGLIWSHKSALKEVASLQRIVEGG